MSIYFHLLLRNQILRVPVCRSYQIQQLLNFCSSHIAYSISKGKQAVYNNYRGYKSNLEELNESLRNRDKMNDDAIAQLSDQLMALTALG